MKRTRSQRRRDRWSESKVARIKACLLVAGTRTFDDEQLLKKELDKLKGKYDVRVVIVGDASGVDKMAEQWAYKLRPVGVIVHIHYADWKKHKKAAGPIRNQEMVDDLVSRKEAKKKIAVFFWDGESPGTFDCLKRCRKAKVKRKVVRYE